MANIYVRSTDGLDADNGSTWALAKATLTGAAAIDAAGDNIYVSQSHAESSGSAVTLALAGSVSNPVKIIGASDAAEPPTSVSVTPSVTTTSGDISVTGAAYVRGINFTSAAGIVLNGGSDSVQQIFENCKFRSNSATTAGQVKLGAGGNFTKKQILKNCNFYFSQTTQQVLNSGVDLYIEGGGLTAGSASPANMFASLSDRSGARTTISGFDLSAASAGINIFSKNNASASAPGLSACLNVIRNSKLPAAWSGDVVDSVNAPGQRYELHNCDSGSSNYRFRAKDYFGSIVDESVIVKSGGSSGYSLKMVSSSPASYPAGVLYSPELPAVWNSALGAPITVSVDIIHDSGTNLTDGEIWLEAQYLGESGSPLSSYASDVKANILTAAADQAGSAATWTTTGMSSPNKQKLSVTFTPNRAGFIQGRVCLAKPSKTVYYDNMIVVE